MPHRKRMRTGMATLVVFFGVLLAAVGGARAAGSGETSVNHAKRGEQAYRFENYKSAERHFRAALKLRPDFLFALTGLGWTLYDARRHGEALPVFRKAYRLHPKAGSARRGLAYLLYRKGEREAARELLGSLDGERWVELATIDFELANERARRAALEPPRIEEPTPAKIEAVKQEIREETKEAPEKNRLVKETLPEEKLAKAQLPEILLAKALPELEAVKPEMKKPAKREKLELPKTEEPAPAKLEAVKQEIREETKETPEKNRLVKETLPEEKLAKAQLPEILLAKPQLPEVLLAKPQLPEVLLAEAPPVKERVKFPVELVSFRAHALPRRGIGFQKGRGETVTSPIYGRVRFTDHTRSGKYVGIQIGDDLGFWVAVSCFSKIHAAPNQAVTPLTIIGQEGSNCEYGAGGPEVSRTHITLHLPPFAREFGSPDGKYIARNGIEQLIADPGKYSRGTKKLSYIPAGSTDPKALVREATNRLNLLALDFRDTHLGWFLNRTRHRRPFVRAMVMYRMWQTGILQQPARKRAEEYFRWHAAIKVPVYLPYPNPEFLSSYAKPDPRPKTPKDIVRLWTKDVAPRLARRINNKGILEAILEFQKKSPIQGEAGTEFHLGNAYIRMGQYADAVEHLLIADALSEVHYWNTPERVKKFKFYVADLLIKAYVGTPEFNFAEAFEHKRDKYARWRKTPW